MPPLLWTEDLPSELSGPWCDSLSPLLAPVWFWPDHRSCAPCFERLQVATFELQTRLTEAYVPSLGTILAPKRASIWASVGASPGGQAAKAKRVSESTLLALKASASSVKLTSIALELRASLDSRSVFMASSHVTSVAKRMKNWLHYMPFSVRALLHSHATNPVKVPDYEENWSWLGLMSVSVPSWKCWCTLIKEPGK